AARCRRVDVLLRTVVDVWYLPYEVVGGACLAVRGGEDDAGLSGAPRGRVVRVEPAEVSPASEPVPGEAVRVVPRGDPVWYTPVEDGVSESAGVRLQLVVRHTVTGHALGLA